MKVQRYTNLFEKRLYKWLINNRYRIVFALILSFLIAAFSSAPYVNLYIDQGITMFLVLVVSSALVLKGEHILILGLIVLFPALLFTLVLRPEMAEVFGNIVYGLLFLGVVFSLLRLK